jgi:hypothetical protein
MVSLLRHGRQFSPLVDSHIVHGKVCPHGMVPPTADIDFLIHDRRIPSRSPGEGKREEGCDG